MSSENERIKMKMACEIFGAISKDVLVEAVDSIVRAESKTVIDIKKTVEECCIVSEQIFYRFNEGKQEKSTEPTEKPKETPEPIERPSNL